MREGEDGGGGFAGELAVGFDGGAVAEGAGEGGGVVGDAVGEGDGEEAEVEPSEGGEGEGGEGEEEVGHDSHLSGWLQWELAVSDSLPVVLSQVEAGRDGIVGEDGVSDFG